MSEMFLLSRSSFTATMVKEGKCAGLLPDVPGLAFCTPRFPWLQLIAHQQIVDWQLVPGRWVVSECTSGLAFEMRPCDNAVAAAESALAIIRRMNETQLRQRIQSAVTACGREAWDAGNLVASSRREGLGMEQRAGGFLSPQLAMLLGIAAVMGALTIWGLWERSGRLSCEVARVELDGAYRVLAAQVTEQNAKVRQLAQAGAQARETGRQATIAAEARAQALSGEIESLRGRIAAPTPAGEDCRNAWAEIQRGVGGAAK